MGYPCPIRSVTIDDEAIRINTLNVTDFEWDFRGLEPVEYLKRKFGSLLETALDAAENDIEKLAQIAIGMSIKPESVLKLRGPISLVGRFINNVTLGKLGKMFLISSKIDESIHLLVRDVVIEIIEMYSSAMNLIIREHRFTRQLRPCSAESRFC